MLTAGQSTQMPEKDQKYVLLLLLKGCKGYHPAIYILKGNFGGSITHFELSE
jgi:hypothetical protein